MTSLITGAPQLSEPDTDNPFNQWGASATGSGAILIKAGTGFRYEVPGLPGVNLLDWLPDQLTRWLYPPPPSVPSGCIGQLASQQWVNDACPLLAQPPPPTTTDPTTPTPQPPTTTDIIYQALATTPIPGAGLTIQPTTPHYTGIPTLAHAQHTTHHLTVTILNHPTTITLTAHTYTFDYGDNTTPQTTTHPGAPYPDTTNHHTYTTPHPHRTITLTTTWNATATNPFTGDTHTIPGILQTRETSTPFETRTPHTTLTDTAETQTGH